MSGTRMHTTGDKRANKSRSYEISEINVIILNSFPGNPRRASESNRIIVGCFKFIHPHLLLLSIENEQYN